MTHRFPMPTKSKRQMDHPASPTGYMEVPVPERERRKDDLDRITNTHPLLPIALRCIKDRESERPSTAQLCQSLAALKVAPAYVECVQERPVDAANLQQTRASLKEKEREIRDLRQQLMQNEEQLQQTTQQLDHAIRVKDQVIRRHEQEIRTKDQEIRARDQAVVAKDQEIKAKGQQLQGKEREVADLRRDIADMQQLLAQFQKNLLEREREEKELPQRMQSKEERLKKKEAEVFSMEEVMASAEKVYTKKLKKEEHLKATLESCEEQKMALEEAKWVQEKLKEKNSGLEGEVTKHEWLKEGAEPTGRCVSDVSPLLAVEEEISTASLSATDSPPLRTATTHRAEGGYMSLVGVTHEEPAAEPSAYPAQDQGYDCEFIEPPPKIFQTECPVCLQILRKPYEATCCGTAFCQSCISQVPEKCPTCRREYTLFHSKNLERALKNLCVHCENHKHGCIWTGELGQYDCHLNLNSQLQERMHGCQYTEIKCHNGCGEAIPRQHILRHEMEECSKKRDDHSELEKSLYFYIKELMCVIIQKDERIADLENESKKDVHPDVPIPDESTTSDVKSKLTTSKEEENPAIDESATFIPIQRTIYNFTELQKYNKDHVSKAFYTHPGGYKMCLWVFPNGLGDAEKKYVSVFTSFMKGENDSELRWPFRGSFTVRLVDQVHNKHHKDSIICYDDKASSYAERVIVGEKSQGWGVYEMISHEYLRDPTCQYLKDDCLKIQIVKFDIDPTLPKNACNLM